MLHVILVTDLRSGLLSQLRSDLSSNFVPGFISDYEKVACRRKLRVRHELVISQLQVSQKLERQKLQMAETRCWFGQIEVAIAE